MTFDLEKAWSSISHYKIENPDTATPALKELVDQANLAEEMLAEIERLRDFRGRIARMLEQSENNCDDLLILGLDARLGQLRRQATRIKELEDALVEAKATIKFCLDEGDEDENYGPMHDLPEWRELPEKDKGVFRDWCRKQLRAEGKIGPDAKEAGQEAEQE